MSSIEEIGDALYRRIGEALISFIKQPIGIRQLQHGTVVLSDRARVQIEGAMQHAAYAHLAEHGVLGLCTKCHRTIYTVDEMAFAAWLSPENMAYLLTSVTHRTCGAVQ